jgi:hypothetical protein
MIGHPLADALDAPLRVLMEAGYNRTISPGQPTPWNPLYVPNPISLVVNLAVSIPAGLDNGLQDIIGSRPFGTQRPGPYGVGGPSVTYLNPADTTATSQTTAPTMPSVSSRVPSFAMAAAPRINVLDKEAHVRGSTTSPAPLSSPDAPAEVSAPADESKDEPAPQAEDPAPAVTAESTTNGLKRGSGSHSPQPKVTPRFATAPVSKLHAGLKRGQMATSSNPSDCASGHRAAPKARSAASK